MTMVDAQFGVGRVLRPFDGFEAVYQGQSATIPIAFPGDLDEDAGKPGFSPYLLRGIPVPLGAKMKFWFPMVTVIIGEGTGFYDYVYLLHWRLRNIGDFGRKNGQTPYHLAKDSFGAPDTLLAPGSPQRFVLPSGTESVIYQQNEPTATAPFADAPGPGVGNLRTDLIAIPDDLSLLGATASLPLLPPNSAPPFASPYPVSSTTPLGAFSQGVIDPAASTIATTSLYRTYNAVAEGDELIISVVRRPQNPVETPFVWDFSSGGPDEEFSNLYGVNVGGTSHRPFPDLGVIVFTGTNPS